jgi:N-acetyl-gamma-glutamyl-phosphate/LysW-gamma-L-alpha-aminoadipyl-6-phosphate reductase
MTSKPIGVGILGGSGYGAGELLRLLPHHPAAEVVAVTSTTGAGEPVASVHTHLRCLTDLRFDAELPFGRFDDYEHAVVIASLPHGVSGTTLAALAGRPEAAPFRFIDLSGDLRLRDPSEHARHYPGVPWLGELRERFVYGLAELNRDAVAAARFVANPGCLASACALAGLPLRGKRLVGSLVFDAKTGTSGAGRSPQASMHHPTRHGNFEAYKVLAHRHESEIRQALGGVETMFVPHLLPVARGIFVTAYATFADEADAGRLPDDFRRFYAREPFIRLVEGSPNLHDVVGTNFCDISVTVRGRQTVVMAALDNLVKGMTGQAIQNMNLMCGLPETAGLNHAGFGTS